MTYCASFFYLLFYACKGANLSYPSIRYLYQSSYYFLGLFSGFIIHNWREPTGCKNVSSYRYSGLKDHPHIKPQRIQNDYEVIASQNDVISSSETRNENSPRLTLVLCCPVAARRIQSFVKKSRLRMRL